MESVAQVLEAIVTHLATSEAHTAQQHRAVYKDGERERERKKIDFLLFTSWTRAEWTRRLASYNSTTQIKVYYYYYYSGDRWTASPHTGQPSRSSSTNCEIRCLDLTIHFRHLFHSLMPSSSSSFPRVGVNREARQTDGSVLIGHAVSPSPAWIAEVSFCFYLATV